jgi:hypothetical protein
MSNHYRGLSQDDSYQVSIHLATWPPQAILVSDWLISKKIISSETAGLDNNVCPIVRDKGKHPLDK